MEVVTNNWFTKKYPIGFALSGGFIKGFAHLGAMQSLLEHDIKPNILSGVSAGASAGVFYADGNEPHQVLDYFAGHKFQDLTKLVIPKVGLFELGEFIDFLKSNLKSKKLEELQIPLIITATDLDHGRLVHFHKGDIAERVAASCCMPVVCHGQYRRHPLRGRRSADEPACLYPPPYMRKSDCRECQPSDGDQV